MSPLPLSPIDLPHVAETIAESFSFVDILSCIRVSRAWNDAFIPLLWADVVTFRTNHWIPPILTPVNCHAMIRNSHHIRALTCSIDAIPVLLECTFDNLLEINFVADEYRTCEDPRPPVGLNGLGNVIALCPRLHAVSLERIDVQYNNEAKELRAFVDLLDTYSNITCLYFSYRDFYNCTNFKVKSLDLIPILEQRLARVPKSTIKSLTIRDAEELTRSQRGLPVAAGSGERQHRWPGREQLLKDYYKGIDTPRTLPNKSRGRWEHEGGRKSSKKAPDAVAVLENGGVLEVCLPSLDLVLMAQVGLSPSTLMQRYPALTRVHFGKSDCRSVAFLLQQLPMSHPQVRELEICKLYHNSFGTFLNDARVNLSSISLREVPSGMWELTSRKLVMPGSALSKAHFFRHALVSLQFAIHTRWPLDRLFEVMASCPNLQTLSAPRVSVKWTEKNTDHPWICQGLRSLNLHLKDIGEVGVGNVNKVARDVMEQLGRMHQLQDLAFHVNTPTVCSSSPFLTLALGVENGLERLAGLSRLESLEISGLCHNVGPIEIEWMSKHWPRLEMIELPVLDVNSVTGENMLAFFVNGEVSPPDFSAWFPRLRFIVPEMCYPCRCCGRQSCFNRKAQ